MATVDMARIASNIGALNALNSLNSVNRNLAIAQTRLATGRRINSAEDDPAGLTFATKFQYRAEGYQVALGNIGDAKNLLSTAEGALRKINDILIKVRAKAQSAISDTLGSTERSDINAQITDLLKEVDDLNDDTKWNGQALVDGTYTSKVFQTGAESADTVSFSMTQGHGSNDLALNTVTVASSGSAQTYMNSVDTAIASVSTSLRTIGALMGRLTFKEEAVTVAHANTEAAYNRVMNADMAREQVKATKFLILQQTATAMLSQANTNPQAVLSLFR